MDLPVDPDVSHTVAFKNLQFQFINWAARWTNRGDDTQHIPVTLSDTVNILQALGFKVRHCDICLPEDTTPLEHGNKGIRLIASCNHSGQRFYLEKPVYKDDCQCKQTVHDGGEKDVMWEIATARPSVEQDSMVKDVLPSLSGEMKQITYSVVNYLLYMMHASAETKTVLTSATPLPVATAGIETRFDVYREPSCVTKVSSLQEDFMVIPDITVSSPRNTSSSGRYRSLDTLMSREGNADFPPPRPLVSEDLSESSGVAHSIENFAHLSRSDIRSDVDRLDRNRDAQNLKSAVALLKRAYRNLFNGILLLERNSVNESLDSVFEQTTNMMEYIEKRTSSAGNLPTTTASGLDLSTSTPNKEQSQSDSDTGEDFLHSTSAGESVSAGFLPDSTEVSLHAEADSKKTHKGPARPAVVRAVSSPNLRTISHREAEQVNSKMQVKKGPLKPSCGKSTKFASKASSSSSALEKVVATKIGTTAKAVNIKKKNLTTATQTKQNIPRASALMTRAASSIELKSTTHGTQQPQLLTKQRRVSLFSSNNNFTKSVDKPSSVNISTCGVKSNVKKSHSFKVLRKPFKDEKDATTSKTAKSTMTKATSSPSILKSTTATAKRSQPKLNPQKVLAEGPSTSKASILSSLKITKR